MQPVASAVLSARRCLQTPETPRAYAPVILIEGCLTCDNCDRDLHLVMYENISDFLSNLELTSITHGEESMIVFEVVDLWRTKHTTSKDFLEAGTLLEIKERDGSFNTYFIVDEQFYKFPLAFSCDTKSPWSSLKKKRSKSPLMERSLE
jgi:hypothetical protein